MRPSILAVAALSCLASSSVAQAAEGSERPWLGGFGFAFQGISHMEVRGPDSALEAALGEGGGLGGFFWQYGGGGKALIWNFLLAGRGYGLVGPESATGLGSARVGGGGGGFELGYTVVRSQAWLVYPYGGIGGYGLDMGVRNGGDEPLTLGDRLVIAPGDSTTCQTGYLAVEWGLGLQRLLHDGQGGFQLGAEMGFQMSLRSQGWSLSGGGDLTGMGGAPGIVTGFFRLTVGGGGYFLRP